MPPRFKDSPRVVRGRTGDRQRLHPDFETLARGEKMSRRPRPNDRLDDPRAVFAITGVANHDARVVYDARTDELRALIAANDDAAVADKLAEAVQLGLWRGRAITDFFAWCVDVLGIDGSRGEELARTGSKARGWPLERASDRVVATWIRIEAGFARDAAHARSPEATPPPSTTTATVTLDATRTRVRLDAPLAGIAEGFATVARSLSQIAPAPPRRERRDGDERPKRREGDRDDRGRPRPR